MYIYTWSTFLHHSCPLYPACRMYLEIWYSSFMQFLDHALFLYFSTLILMDIFFESHYLLQDILRLLTLWFNHGATAEVQMALRKGFEHVNINTWLVVLPQIIARIHSNNHAVRELIQSLLVRIGQSHPQVWFRWFLCIWFSNPNSGVLAVVTV